MLDEINSATLNIFQQNRIYYYQNQYYEILNMIKQYIKKAFLAGCLFAGSASYSMDPAIEFSARTTDDEFGKHLTMLIELAKTYRPNIGFANTEATCQEAEIVINMRLSNSALLQKVSKIICTELREGFQASLYAMGLAAAKQNHPWLVWYTIHSILSKLSTDEAQRILIDMCRDTILVELLPYVVHTQAAFTRASLFVGGEANADSSSTEEARPIQRTATPYLPTTDAMELNCEILDISTAVKSNLAREISERHIMIAWREDVRKRLDNLPDLTKRTASSFDYQKSTQIIECVARFAETVDLSMAQIEHLLVGTTTNNSPA